MQKQLCFAGFEVSDLLRAEQRSGGERCRLEEDEETEVVEEVGQVEAGGEGVGGVVKAVEWEEFYNSSLQQYSQVREIMSAVKCYSQL